MSVICISLSSLLPVLPSSKSIPPSFLLPFSLFPTPFSLNAGCCQASDMYVEQLKDVLKHSCPKRIAGFFAEPIQVRLTTRTQTGKFLTYVSLPPLFPLPPPVSPSPLSPFFLPLSPSSSFSPSFSLPFFLFPLSPSLYLTIVSQGVGGSVQLPKGFLKKAFEAVREKGGLCISDEVSEEEDHTHWAYQDQLFIYILTCLVYNW